jgi:serine phosphatase RsbU (regulator of sigma subunit)
MTARDLEIVARMVDRLPDPSLLLDNDLKLVRYNPAFVAFSELKYRLLEPLFLKAASAFEVVGDPCHEQIARECISSGRPTRLEDVQIHSPSGSRKTAMVAFVPIASLEGEPLGLIYSVRDVSGDVELHKRYKRLLQQEQERVRVLEEREIAVQNDLMEAKLFQESLIPPPPQLEGIRLAVRYLPAELVSGDLYHAHAIDGGIRVLIADASGHGVQASLRTMVIKTEYDQIKSSAADPAELLALLSDRFAHGYAKTQLHFTACCFDVMRRPNARPRLRYASAGHPPLLRLSGGRVAEIRASGPYPGLMPGEEFALAEVDLAAGDRILAFTDGFVEQARRDGTQFDEARISAALERLPGSVEDAIDRGLGELFGFLGEDQQSDDITVVGVEID